MKQHILEFWVGVFVMLGIAALVFLSLQVAGGGSGSLKSGSSYTVYANFTDIGGLKVKAPVKASGVVVGRVSGISLNPQTYEAQVSMELAENYTFSSDVAAQILTSGILGEQYIGLQQGGDPDNLQNGDTIAITNSAMVLENLIGKFMAGIIDKQE